MPDTEGTPKVANEQKPIAGEFTRPEAAEGVVESTPRTYPTVVTGAFRLGSETDDAEHCVEDWLKKSRDAGWQSESQVAAMFSMALNPETEGVSLVAVIGREDVRLKGVYIFHIGVCGGRKTLEVPLINFVRKLSREEEDDVVDDIIRTAEKEGCDGIAVSVLKSQKSIEEALRRRKDGVRVGGKIFTLGYNKDAPLGGGK